MLKVRVCACCPHEFLPSGPRQKYCPKCRIEKIRGYKRKYKKSEKGKLAEKRYKHGVKGKAFVKKQNAKESIKNLKRLYCRSSAGKVAAKRYKQSEKGRLRRSAYTHTTTYLNAQKVRRVFKSCLFNKTKKSFYDILGYTTEEAVAYVKGLLIPGMLFEERKTWCIHHIKPIASFSGDIDDIIKKANALDNIAILTPDEHVEVHRLITMYESNLTYEQALQKVLERRKQICNSKREIKN